MEVVEFEEDRAMGVVIHDGDTESSGRVTFGSSGPERTTITISVDMPWLDDSAAAARLTSLIERNQIRPPFGASRGWLDQDIDGARQPTASGDIYERWLMLRRCDSKGLAR
jgi:hypothetical protein